MVQDWYVDSKAAQETLAVVGWNIKRVVSKRQKEAWYTSFCNKGRNRLISLNVKVTVLV